MASYRLTTDHDCLACPKFYHECWLPPALNWTQLCLSTNIPSSWTLLGWQEQDVTTFCMAIGTTTFYFYYWISLQTCFFNIFYFHLKVSPQQYIILHVELKLESRKIKLFFYITFYKLWKNKNVSTEHMMFT